MFRFVSFISLCYKVVLFYFIFIVVVFFRFSAYSFSFDYICIFAYVSPLVINLLICKWVSFFCSNSLSSFLLIDLKNNNKSSFIQFTYNYNCSMGVYWKYIINLTQMRSFSHCLLWQWNACATNSYTSFASHYFSSLSRRVYCVFLLIITSLSLFRNDNCNQFQWNLISIKKHDL